MKIFILTYAYEQGIRTQTGGIRKVRELGNAMAKIGHMAVIFLPKAEFVPENDRARHEPYNVINFPILRPISAYLSQFMKPLWVSIRSGDSKPDVIYFRTAPTILPLFLSWLTRAKFIIEINGDILNEERGRMASLYKDPMHFFRMRLTVASERINCRRADAVVALTEGLKKTIMSRYGIPEEKVFVIGSGTNADQCRLLDASECRKSFDLDPEKPYINFIGVLYRHQGLSTLIDGAPLILEKYPDAHFLIGGDGPMRKSWCEKVEKMGLSKAFRFMGVIPFEKLPAFLNTATVCVAPFTRTRGETSPLKLFDYMACAKPVVASAIPPIRSLVEKSGGILSVEPDDPQSLASGIVRLLGNDTERMTMGRSGREYVEKYHRWEKIAADTVSAIESLEN